MPPIVYDILDLLGALIRLIGMAVFGLGAGWLLLEIFRKGQQAWQLQLALFLGFCGLAIALAYFTTAGALGAFGIGVGVAMFVWGMPKPKGEEKEED
jgi:membrane-bound ClpP family serine protease